VTKQPEALRLATFCEGNVIYREAASELRRQHALIEELRMALKLIATSPNSTRELDYCKGVARAALAKAWVEQP